MNDTTRQRLGIYWRPVVLSQARSAYVADLDALTDPPVGFARWVEQALQEHNARTPEQRADLAQGLDELPGKGTPQPIWLTTQTISDTRTAVSEDRRAAGRVRSVSDYVSEATRIAVSTTTKRYGRDLPPPPARLPTRPTR